MAKVRIVSELAETRKSSPDLEAFGNLFKLATAIALAACAGIAHAQQVPVRDVIRLTAYSNTITTPAEPRQFGRDSVYATQPPSPSIPVLAGGLTVDEAGGAPVYATRLTHPSGPVMEAANDLQAYGRDGVYVAGSPNAGPPLHFVSRQQDHIDTSGSSQSLGVH